MKKISNVAQKVDKEKDSDQTDGRPGGVCFQNKNAHDIKHASLPNCRSANTLTTEFAEYKK